MLAAIQWTQILSILLEMQIVLQGKANMGWVAIYYFVWDLSCALIVINLCCFLQIAGDCRGDLGRVPFKG